MILSVISMSQLNQVWAQNYFIEQALLFSRQNPGGGARVQALGGAQVALGGDFSTALSNPAGLGFYNRNEFSITPGFTAVNASGNYNLYSGPVNSLSITQVASSASTGTASLPGLAIVFGAGKNTNTRAGLRGIQSNDRAMMEDARLATDYIEEKMDLKKAEMGEVIKDFQKSDAPQFKGKSKAKRRIMAVAAKLQADRGE